MKITLNVPDEIAQVLADCEPGEEKTVTFRVSSNLDGEIQGDVTEVEDYAEELDEESGEVSESSEMEPAAEYSSSHGTAAPKKSKRKMPKAVLMIGLGK